MTPTPLILCASCGVEMEKGGCPDDGRHRRTVTVPASLVALLAEVYRPEGVRLWLRGRHRLLDERRPIDLIAEGRTEEVEAIVHGLIDGVFV